MHLIVVRGNMINMIKMKVNVLSRSQKKNQRETPYDIMPLRKNQSPQVHPFEKGREYKRALNAAKLDRVFAKPFVGALEGHIDGVYVVEKDFHSLNRVYSGSGDGGTFSFYFLIF